MVQSLAMGGEGFLPLSFPFCRRTPVLIQSLGRDKARAGGGRGCTPRGATLLFWSFLPFWRLAGERKSSISCCHRQGWVLAQMWVKSDTLWTTYSFSRPPGFSLLLLSFLFLFIYLFIPPSPLSPPCFAYTNTASTRFAQGLLLQAQPAQASWEQHFPLKSEGLYKEPQISLLFLFWVVPSLHLVSSVSLRAWPSLLTPISASAFPLLFSSPQLFCRAAHQLEHGELLGLVNLAAAHKIWRV